MCKEKQNIAIYGLSSSTQALLAQLDNQYNIIGLLDGYRHSGTLYGKPIISMEQAIEKKVEAIIVVARPSSRRIIVNRIREVCEKQGIKLFDMYGNNLLDTTIHRKSSNELPGVERKELLKRIDENEVISFDIFDTLITRAVLYPTDVYELVEQRILSKYGHGYDFCKKRQEAERALSQSGTPTIYGIYEELEDKFSLNKQELQEILEIEWNTEQEVILPRYDMCQVFQYALEKQKKVYLVSDMYYPAEMLKSLLDKFGIVGYERLLVSCDYGTTKGLELFKILKEIAGDTSYLHIGDNYLSDISSAQRNGIEGAWIRSGIDMFESLYWSEQFAECNNLADRVKLGMFVARIFNSPFVLSESQFAINHPKDFGYLFLAPILSQYCIWLYNMLIQNRETTILLGARDGFLIKKLLDELLSSAEEKSINAIYFLISRVSAVNASIAEEQDVNKLAELAFSGSLKEVLQLRFGLSDEEVAEIEDNQEITVGAILRYKETIIGRAQNNRQNYLKYIDKLGLCDPELSFFDFVSTGTCHLALQKIMNRGMHGYYFIQVESDEPEKKDLKVESFFGLDEAKEEGGIYEDYFILENVLTSPMPSLKGFDESGNPEYVTESRSKEDIDFIMQVQEGIVEYFKQYLDTMKVTKLEEDKRCSETLLKLIHKIPIENNTFSQMVWDDNFYSRRIKVKDLM